MNIKENIHVPIFYELIKYVCTPPKHIRLFISNEAECMLNIYVY